jgi:leucyl/phenylalanyl-tRNA--protein transferase
MAALDRGRSRFPDPRFVPGDAPFGRGADFRPETLVDAYAHGIFPWPYDDGEVYWWSPDPRAVIPLDGLKISRSLRRTVRRADFACTYDRAFDDVMRACAEPRETGTWITAEYMAGYADLHRVGHAHSVEVWSGGELVGGLYGVTVGALFTGESMFHRRTDASKVALVALRDRLRERGFGVIDAQLPTAHLTSMGAVAMPRSEYLDLIADLVARPAVFA